MRIHVGGLLLTMLAAGFAPAAPAQDIALTEHRSRVQIPQTGHAPYVLEVHIPAQSLQGDRFRVSLRRPVTGSAPVSAVGRVEGGQRPQVAMEGLTLQVEGFEVDAASDRTVIWGFSHEISSPRDARSTGAAPAGARAPRVRLAIPLPDLVLADLSASTASEAHKGWVDVQSVGLSGRTPASGGAAGGDVTFVTGLTDAAPPPRLEFEVETGALQRKLARAHQEGSALTVTVRGWDPETKQARTYKLHDVWVKSYDYQGGSTGARVVIETGPPTGSMRAPARSN